MALSGSASEISAMAGERIANLEWPGRQKAKFWPPLVEALTFRTIKGQAPSVFLGVLTNRARGAPSLATRSRQDMSAVALR